MPFPPRDDRTPQHNPDAPPDSSDPSGPCPRCGRISNFEVGGTAPVTFGGGYAVTADGRRERIDVQRVAILECSGCHERVVVIEDKYVGDHRQLDGGKSVGGTINYRGVWWWPPPGVADLDPAIPSDIAEAFREGVRAMWAKAPRASAVMFRRTLEAIVKTTGSAAAQQAANDKNLVSGLGVMADEGALDRSLAEWAKEIRVVGNAGGHFDPANDVSQEEAENLSHLIREVMRYLYEMPARIRRTRKT